MALRRMGVNRRAGTAQQHCCFVEASSCYRSHQQRARLSLTAGQRSPAAVKALRRLACPAVIRWGPLGWHWAEEVRWTDRQHAAWGGMRHGSPSPGGQAPLCKVQSYLCVSASGMRRNAWRHQSGLLAFIRPVDVPAWSHRHHAPTQPRSLLTLRQRKQVVKTSADEACFLSPSHSVMTILDQGDSDLLSTVQ